MAKVYSSKRFRELTIRLNQLSRHLLPNRFSPTGIYTDRQLDLARAYRLLVHSEFEAFLEDASLEVATTAMQLWKKQQKTTIALLGLLAFSGMMMDAPPEKATSKNGTVDISTRLNSAMGSYSYSIRKNHGIKEENILKIVYPIGIQPYDLDPLWLSTIDSFGTKRGETAHTASKTQQPIDPASELSVVRHLLSGLADIDKKLGQLLC